MKKCVFATAESIIAEYIRDDDTVVILVPRPTTVPPVRSYS